MTWCKASSAINLAAAILSLIAALRPGARGKVGNRADAPQAQDASPSPISNFPTGTDEGKAEP